MTDIHPLNQEELKEAVRLADEVFRDEEQPSMGPAFPNIFSNHLIGQSFGAFEDGHLVSFMGLVPAIIQVEHARLKAFSLGSVFTLSDYRGKGLASQILEAITKHTNQAGASLLLVSGSRSLYRRANCHPFGNAQRFTIDSASAHRISEGFSSKTVRLREMDSTDWLKLTELAQARNAHFEQSVGDLSRLIESEAFASVNKHHHKVLVAEENQGLTGFIVIGVPYAQKAQPVVYEYAGDPHTIAPLMAKAIKEFHLDSLDIPVPWHEEVLSQALSVYSTKVERNFGTVKVIGADRLIEQLGPYLRLKQNELNGRLCVKSIEEDQVELRMGADRTVLNSEEFVSFVFDTEPKIESSHPLIDDLKSLFPIPFPYVGSLNYV